MTSTPKGVAALGFFVAVSLVVVGPQVWPLSEISSLSYNPDDVRIFLWNFWWTSEAISSATSPYWTDLLFHPYGTSLAFHSYPLPYSLLSIPIQYWLPGLTGLTVAFNLVVLLSFVASGFCAYLLAHRITGSRAGAVIAGLLFTFGPFHFLNMARLHMLVIECLPLYLLALLHFARRPSPAAGGLLGVALALAFYSSLEYALHLALFSMLWMAYALLRRRSLLGRSFFTGLAVSIGVFLVIAAPLLVSQSNAVAAADGNVERSLDSAQRWSPALASLFAPSRLHPLLGESLSSLGEYRDAGVRGMRSESSLGVVRLLLVALALIGFRRSRRDGRAFWALSAAVFTCLALGPFLRLTGTWMTEIPLPYLGLYEVFPPLRASRSPGRFLALASLLLSVLAAYGMKDLLERLRAGRARTFASWGVGALCVFELLVSRPGSVDVDPDPKYAELASVGAQFAVMDLSSAPSAMLAQIVHQRPITWAGRAVPRSARSGKMLPVQRSFSQPKQLLQKKSAARADLFEPQLHALKRLGVGFVIVPQGPQQKSRIQLAREMGAEISLSRDIAVCDFRKRIRALR